MNTRLRLELEVASLRSILLECALMLQEVRTGEDFETECWDTAARAFKTLGVDSDGNPLEKETQP